MHRDAINLSDHHATYTGFKSRGNLTWHITPDAMLYYTYSQGYRPGAFNRVTGGRTQIWVGPNGQPLANGVVANPLRLAAPSRPAILRSTTTGEAVQ